MISFELISSEGPIERYEPVIQTTAKLWPTHAWPPLTLRGIFAGRDYVVVIVVENDPVVYNETPGVLANGMIVDTTSTVLCLFSGVILNPPNLTNAPFAAPSLPPVVPAEFGTAFGAN